MGTVKQLFGELWYAFRVRLDMATPIIFGFLAPFHEYNASASTTYVANGQNFSILYGDNTFISGILDVDTVTVSFCTIIERKAEC
jgi:hypothetical protein